MQIQYRTQRIRPTSTTACFLYIFKSVDRGKQKGHAKFAWPGEDGTGIVSAEGGGIAVACIEKGDWVWLVIDPTFLLS
jgi:hypothetical protein